VRLANEVLKRVAGRLGLTEMQVGLAWLLRRAKVMLPIPGTSSVKHVEENVGAAGVELPEGVFEELSRVRVPPASLRG
jgi:aryl-alcohol dehydrogenase-like predicted oxidoreductase